MKGVEDAKRVEAVEDARRVEGVEPASRRLGRLRLFEEVEGSFQTPQRRIHNSQPQTHNLI